LYNGLFGDLSTTLSLSRAEMGMIGRLQEVRTKES
jgi:hypothetical protein